MSKSSSTHIEIDPSRLSRVRLRLMQLVAVEPGEMRALCWSFTYFFALLCGYYIIRPMRDEMGIAGGVDKLQWMFTGTFLVMLAAVPLFGWVAKRFLVRQFLPYVYYFFIANLILFFALFKSDVAHAYIARGFFIWASVFNLFIVSVFWSFMADIFNNDQAKRLFGVIAAGGTAGALIGPVLTAILVNPLGPANMLLISAAFLAVAVWCIHRIIAWKTSVYVELSPDDRDHEANRGSGKNQAIGGSIFAGIRLVFSSSYLAGICLLILLYTTLATFLYFQQAQIVRDSFDNSASRTALFAAMDFAVNFLTIVTQLLLTSRIVRKWGLHWTLALIPLLLGLGFLMLGMMPTLSILIAVQVLRRSGNYAVMRPAREMLYVVLGKEEKYKAKNFIDTVVYRGGDAVSAWVFAGLKAMGMSLAGIALVAIPLTGIWAWISFKLGKRQAHLATQNVRT
ncbi:MAG: MFS transporter [Deltaproteobacteria bacterium]|jgi:AAA family ATP:ADP antiporter|nr:MFS transporter [Deltaproteobacteria bacterium]